ncbi:MAG TPA: diguanylate cyclase, partial [Gammaproteobacteria bacterium]|nr:diguanylate cyclase [Gammaproteobacteria bacterium]
GSQVAVESVGNELDPVNIKGDIDEDELRQWPNVDTLTRTSNERGLTISILELMALADRYGRKLSIGMIKIDGIDRLEESDAEDLMINTAGIMTESLRMPDRIGRFRDNVFMALLPESDIDGAEVVADRLRENIEKGMSDIADKVSVWIGITEFHRGEDLQSLLDRVESAVVQSAKEENGICIKPI